MSNTERWPSAADRRQVQLMTSTEPKGAVPMVAQLIVSIGMRHRAWVAPRRRRGTAERFEWDLHARGKSFDQDREWSPCSLDAMGRDRFAADALTAVWMGREIRRDSLPRHTFVTRAMHVLRTVVKHVRIVRRRR